MLHTVPCLLEDAIGRGGGATTAAATGASKPEQTRSRIIILRRAGTGSKAATRFHSLFVRSGGALRSPLALRAHRHGAEAEAQ